MATKKQEIILQKFEFGTAVGVTTAGTYVLGSLPKGATIRQAWIDVDTTFTSATDAATIALGYTGATTAFDAATAISVGTTWDAAVPRVSDGAADGAVGNFIVIASDVNILATTAVETITAGKGYVYIEYVIN